MSLAQERRFTSVCMRLERQEPKFQRLSAADGRAVLEIVADTKAGEPTGLLAQIDRQTPKTPLAPRVAQ